MILPSSRITWTSSRGPGNLWTRCVFGVGYLVHPTRLRGRFADKVVNIKSHLDRVAPSFWEMSHLFAKLPHAWGASGRVGPWSPCASLAAGHRNSETAPPQHPDSRRRSGCPSQRTPTPECFHYRFRLFTALQEIFVSSREVKEVIWRQKRRPSGSARTAGTNTPSGWGSALPAGSGIRWWRRKW